MLSDNDGYRGWWRFVSVVRSLLFFITMRWALLFSGQGAPPAGSWPLLRLLHQSSRGTKVGPWQAMTPPPAPRKQMGGAVFGWRQQTNHQRGSLRGHMAEVQCSSEKVQRKKMWGFDESTLDFNHLKPTMSDIWHKFYILIKMFCREAPLTGWCNSWGSFWFFIHLLLNSCVEGVRVEQSPHLMLDFLHVRSAESHPGDAAQEAVQTLDRMQG